MGRCIDGICSNNHSLFKGSLLLLSLAHRLMWDTVSLTLSHLVHQQTHITMAGILWSPNNIWEIQLTEMTQLQLECTDWCLCQHSFLHCAWVGAIITEVAEIIHWPCPTLLDFVFLVGRMWASNIHVHSLMHSHNTVCTYFIDHVTYIHVTYIHVLLL
jgi:hypothetical protein